MPSDNEFSDEKIEKMLEEARMKTVPPQVLKGFKDDVMRKIEAQSPRGSAPGPKPGSWFAGGFRLPRVQMTVGAGAFACLILISLVAVTVDRPTAVAPAFKEARAVVAVPGISVQTSDMMKAASQPQAPSSQAGAPAAARKTALTVEEELRLIEEFDDRRFFIRQDITEDELASA